MAEPISIQQLKDASEDAISLAEFINKPENAMIPRRLASDIHSLQYYLEYMKSFAQRSYETYDEMVANAVNLPSGVSAFVTNDLDNAKNGIYTYNGTSFVKGEYQPENIAKEFVEAKLGGLQVFDGKVRAQDVSTVDGSTQDVKNTEFRNELDELPPFEGGVLDDTFVTATANGVGTVARTQRDVNSDTVNLKTYGGDPNSPDNTTALQDAANTGKKVVISGSNAKYAVKGTVNFPNGILLDFQDGAEIIANEGVYSDAVLMATGSISTLPSLSANVKSGDTQITFAAAHNLELGDIIIIYNRIAGSFSGFRDFYNAGEYAKVKSVSGNTVLLQAPTYDKYNFADVTVYKVRPTKVNITNPKITSDGSALGLIKATFANNISISKPVLRNSNNNCISITASLGGSVDLGDCTNIGDVGDDYGVVIANSQDISVNGGTYYARRHGVAVGGSNFAGAIPNRNIKFNGCDISNDVSTGVHAADYHGNTEYSGFYGCNIKGGATWQGKNNDIENCTITSMLSGACVLAAEVIGGTAKINGNTFIVHNDPSNTGRGVIDFGGNSEPINALTTENLTILAKNNTVKSDKLSAITSILIVSNRGTAKKINIDCSDNKLQVNNFYAALALRNISGTAASDFIIVDNNTAPVGITPFTMPYDDIGFGGSAYHDLPVLRMQSSNFTDTLVTSTTTKQIVGTSVNYKWRYPRIPTVITNIQGSGSVGAIAVTSSAIVIADSGATISIYNTGTANFTEVKSIKVAVSAYIKDI